MIAWTWWFHCRLLDTVSPNIFAWSTTSSGRLLIVIGSNCCFSRLKLILISLLFLKDHIKISIILHFEQNRIRRSEAKHISYQEIFQTSCLLLLVNYHYMRTWDSYILMSFKVLTYLVPPWNEVILKDHKKICIILHFEENRMRRSEEKHVFVSRNFSD